MVSHRLNSLSCVHHSNFYSIAFSFVRISRRWYLRYLNEVAFFFDPSKNFSFFLRILPLADTATVSLQVHQATATISKAPQQYTSFRWVCLWSKKKEDLCRWSGDREWIFSLHLLLPPLSVQRFCRVFHSSDGPSPLLSVLRYPCFTQSPAKLQVAGSIKSCCVSLWFFSSPSGLSSCW